MSARARANARATRRLRRNDVDKMHGLVDDGGVRVAKEREEAAALSVALGQRAHHIKFDVLLQRAASDAENRRHAQPEAQRLKQQAAPHRLSRRQVCPDLVEVQRYGLATQERGLGGLACDCEVGAAGCLAVLIVDRFVGCRVALRAGGVGLRGYPAGDCAAKVEVVYLRKE